MKLRIIRDAQLVNLRDEIGNNLDRYRTGDFAFLDLDATQFHEIPVESDDSKLADLKMPDGTSDFEVANCLAVYRYLEQLKPYDARDQRLWVYLSHTVLLEYARKRWPIPSDDEKAISHIATHFFAGSNRQIERDNVASRLWWMAHLCTRVSGVDQQLALEAFLLKTDVRANIIERPTVAQSAGLFSALLKTLIASASGKRALFERVAFRKLMVELNSVGGYRLLDCLPESELKKILDEVVKFRIGLAVV